MRIKKEISFEKLDKYFPLWHKIELDNTIEYSNNYVNQDGDDVWEVTITISKKSRKLKFDTYRCFNYVEKDFLIGMISDKIKLLIDIGLVEE